VRSAAKDQFLRYVFHELRVPLNSVSLSIEELWLSRSGLGEGSQELIGVATQQVRTLPACGGWRVCPVDACAVQLSMVTRILNDTLFFAKLEVS
jgi:signal transduction histidine kinase